MTILLRIDSSLRLKESYSRKLGDYFVQVWQEKKPNGKIRERDLGQNFIPHLDQKTLDCFYDETIKTELLHHSDTLITELFQCNEILITAPMYNFGLSSSLKAYFDLVVRTDKTFRYEGRAIGLLGNKNVYIISSMGDIKTEPFNFVELHLKQILNYVGLTEISFISIDGTSDDNYVENILPIQINKINEILNQ